MTLIRNDMIRKVMLTMVGVAALLMPATPGLTLTSPTVSDEPHWIDRLTEEVVTIQYMDTHPDRGKMQPYLRQLAEARQAFYRGNGAEVRTAMNRFMDMLEARENRISGKTADEIFDLCYQMTPAAFHEAGRHVQKYETDTAVYWEDFWRDAGGTR